MIYGLLNIISRAPDCARLEKFETSIKLHVFVKLLYLDWKWHCGCPFQFVYIQQSTLSPYFIKLQACNFSKLLLWWPSYCLQNCAQINNILQYLVYFQFDSYEGELICYGSDVDRIGLKVLKCKLWLL